MSIQLPAFIKKLLGETAIYGISNMLGRLINFLLVPIYTAVFAPEEFAIITELYGYVAFALIVLTHGMETTYFRFKADKNEVQTFATAFKSVFIATTSFIIVGWCLVPFLAPRMGFQSQQIYLQMLILIIGLDCFAALPFARLRALQQAGKFALLKFSSILLNISFVLFFLFVCPKVDVLKNWFSADFGVGYVFLSNLIASGIILGVLSPHFGSLFRNWSNAVQWKPMITFALPLMIVGFAGTINEMLDRVALKYWLTGSLTENQYQLGVYGACYKLSIFITLFVQAFRYAAEPFFFAQTKQKNQRQMYAQVMHYFLFAASLGFIVVALFLDYFKLLIDAAYHEGLYVVPILLMANLFLGLQVNVSIWFKVTNKTVTGMWIALGAALLTFIGNYCFVPEYGYLASAVTTLVCYISMVLVTAYIGQQKFPIPYQWLSVIISLVLVTAVYGLYHQLPSFKPLLSIPIRIILVGLTAILLFIITQRAVKKVAHDNSNY